MATDKQTTANQRNALASTGPKTLNGKATASQNAQTHGLLSREVVAPAENREEFEAFRSSLLEGLAPRGALEDLLADRVVSSAWRLRRATRIESALFLPVVSFEWNLDPPEGEEVKKEVQDSSPQGAFVSRGDHLERLGRYERGIENALFRALHELQRLRAERQGVPVPPPAALDVTVTAAPEMGFD